MVQILHCGSYQHWIVASTLNCPKDTVYLYNSFDENIPELSESYFGYPTGDMIECTYCKEWYHDCCRKIPKKYFTNEALDYFCSKVCHIESDKSMSLSY